LESRSPFVRASVIKALGLIGDRETIPILEPYASLKNDTFMDIERIAKEAISQIRSRYSD
jgi:HEAT repeat protein